MKEKADYTSGVWTHGRKLFQVFVVLSLLLNSAGGTPFASAAPQSEEGSPLSNPADFGIRGDAVEVKELRTAQTKTFKLPSRQYSQVATGQPLHYKDDSGVWQDIDLQFEKRGGEYVLDKNITVVTVDDHSITLRDRETNASLRLFPETKPIVKNNVIRFEAEGLTWSWIPEATGLKLLSEKILKPRGVTELVFPFETDLNHELILENNALKIGGITIRQPVAFGADGNEYACRWNISGNTVALNCDDSNWPSEAYPYVIDPTDQENASAGNGDVARSGCITTDSWNLPSENPIVNDSVRSHYQLNDGQCSEWLYLYDWGFAIPTTTVNIIDNISFQIDAQQGGSGAGNIRDDYVTLTTDGTTPGTNHASSTLWTTGDVTVTYDYSRSNWGFTTSTLTPAIINSSAFGTLFSAESVGGLRSAQVDAIFNMIVTYSPAPTITSVIGQNPQTTAGGKYITIDGTGFVSGATVSVGGTPATGVVFVGGTRLVALAPANASGSYSVAVVNPNEGNTSSSNAMAYIGPPSGLILIETYAPANATGTSRVFTATGGNFSTSSNSGCPIKVITGATSTETGTCATSVSGSRFILSFTIPNLSSGTYSLRAYGIQGNFTNGIYSDVPIIYVNKPSGLSISDAFVPASTSGVTSTVSGTNIGVALSFPLTIGSATTTINSTTTTSVTLTVPSGSANATSAIRVYGSNGSDSNGVYTDDSSLTITYIAKPSGLSLDDSYVKANTSGTRTVSGSGIGYTLACPVKLNSTCAPVVSTTTGSVTFTATSSLSAGTYTLRVYGANGSDANSIYTDTSLIYTNGPSNVAINSNQLSGNTASQTSTFTGLGISTSTNPIRVGTSSLATYVSGSSSSLVVTMPQMTPGIYDVRVYGIGGTNSNGIYTDLSNFVVYSPYVTAISPVAVSTVGGETVTISGQSLKVGSQGAKITPPGGVATYLTTSGNASSTTFTTPSSTSGGAATLRIYGTGGSDANGIYIDTSTLVYTASTYTQSGYRWYENANSATPGSPKAALNTSSTITTTMEAARLRLLIDVTTIQSLVGDTFKLQMASTTSACSAGLTYADVSSASGAIRFNDNAGVSDGSALTTTSTDPTHSGHTNIPQTYQESNPITTLSAMTTSTDGLWDFSLYNFSMERGSNYCFRMVKGDGTALDTYSVIPQITFPNFAPELQNVSASENASGTVNIAYEARDSDTNAAGAINPGYITPSFEYWNGSSWTTIATSTLGGSDYGNQSVTTSTFTAHTATWSAQNQISGVYYATSAIRITVSDSESVNSTVTTTTASFALDTKNPTVSTLTFDSRNDFLTIVASDNSNLQYRASNSSTFVADGQNASSGIWIAVGSSTLNTTTSWIGTGASSTERVYAQIADVYNNSTTLTVVAPALLSNVSIADISNGNASFYAETVSWTGYTSITSSTLSFYEIWRSVNSTSSFSVFASTTNTFYTDTGLNTLNTYYYKVTIKTTEGNYADFSSIVSDRPDGQGNNIVPDFDTSYDTVHQAGAIAYQVATSTDADWGRVKISYSVRDANTTSTFIWPSFEYNIGTGWVVIPSSTLGATDTNAKVISSSTFTTYTATWNASSQISGAYSQAFQIRVTASDGESTGNTIAAPHTLDTNPPLTAATSLLVNGASANAEATSTTALTLQLQSITGAPIDETIYARFSQDNTTWYGANSDGTLTTSTASWGTGFSSAAGTLSGLSWPWSLGGSTIYVQVVDGYTNGPATDSITVTGYNQAPEFQSVSVSEATSSDPRAGGQININYSIRDLDSTSATSSFAYSLNGGAWTVIATSTMNSTSTDAKSVASGSYTGYTATWFATSTVSSTYTTNLAIRVTLSDGQSVNATASSSATLTFDSKAPTVGSGTLLINSSSVSVESVSSTISLSLQSIVGNPTDETVYVQFSDDDSTWYGANSNGTLASSSAWGTGFSSGTSTLTSLSWPFTVSGRSRTLYTRVTDAFGNGLPSDTNSVGYNAPPDFNSGYGVNGLSVSQVSSSTDSDWGKVRINYSIRDTDTASGSSTPGYISPSFEYNIGLGWNSITTSTLAANDTSNKAVDASSYTTYTATWNASSQVAATYSTALQIRVTANDNESVSNTVQATSSQATVDTKVPTVAVQVDGRSNRVSVIATDDSNLEYELSNLSTLASDGSNASSGVWIATNATSTNTSSSWSLLTSSSLQTVYYGVRDGLSNLTTGSASAPIAPASTSITDVSDTSLSTYKELVSWTVYTSTSSAPFSKYEVYRATDSDPSTFTLLASVTDISQNYYTDTGLNASSTYYYKVSIVTTNSDYSPYGTTVSDQPDGLSGAAASGPTITSVSAAEVQASWARITWTTDRVSDSEVEYSIATSSTPYGLSTSTVTLVTSHDVYVGDLLPNTTYSFRVVSTDVNSKQSTVAGTDFTTLGGPIISSVTTESVTDHTAAIVWVTNKDANSTVVYSTSLQNLRDGVNTSQAGNSSLVGPPYQHRVTLSGLTTQTIYYYYVKSTDASNNISTDKNSGNFYTFSTTQDVKAPVISNVAVAAVTKNSAVVTWQTDEPANSQMSYDTRSASSTGQSHRNLSSLDDTLTTNHAITITGLSASTTYYFTAKSIDAAGNLSFSNEESLTTTDTETITIYSVSGGGPTPAATASVLKDTTPPLISNVTVSDITPFSAKVSFDTDEDSLGFVSFGEDTKYGRNPGETSFRKDHQIGLVGLKLGTTYHFQVGASDKNGNFTTSLDNTFKTKFAVEAGDIAKLENVEQYQSEIDTLIESITPSLVTPFVGRVDVTDITENSAVIKWTTNTKTYGSVLYISDKEYDEKNENPYLTEVSDTQPRTTTHQVKLNSLSPGQLYRFKVKSYTLPNVVGMSVEKTFTTKTSKIRSDIVRLFNTSFVVTWQTPKPTTSFVEYFNNKTKQIKQTGNDTSVTAHVVNVENLNPDTTYRVRAFGYDANNNLVESEPINVTTKKDIIPPVVSNLKIDNTFVPGRNDRIQAVVSWKTDEPATSLVRYGEGSAPYQKELPSVASSTDTSLGTNHSIIITNFKPGVIYQLQVISVDGAGNRAASPIRVIITPKQTQSVFDVIVKNFEGTFKFINQ